MKDNMRMCKSWGIFLKGLLWLISVLQLESGLNLIVEPFGVGQHVAKSSYSSTAHVHDVLHAVVDPVNGCTAAQSARVQAEFDSLSAVRHSFSKVSNGAAMAYWSAYFPAAMSALQISQSAGFTRMPLIDALSNAAGSLAAAQASKDFIDHIHDEEIGSDKQYNFDVSKKDENKFINAEQNKPIID